MHHSKWFLPCHHFIVWFLWQNKKLAKLNLKLPDHALDSYHLLKINFEPNLALIWALLIFLCKFTWILHLILAHTCMRTSSFLFACYTQFCDLPNKLAIDFLSHSWICCKHHVFLYACIMLKNWTDFVKACCTELINMHTHLYVNWKHSYKLLNHHACWTDPSTNFALL